MAWDSAPPTAEELQPSTPAAAGGSWDAAPPTPEELKATEPMSLSGFGKNLVSDAKQNVTGLLDLGQGIVERPIDTAANVIKSLPGGIVNEGKRLGVGELLTGHPINAVEKLGRAAYEKPLTTGMEVAPFIAGEEYLNPGEEAATGEAGKAAEDMMRNSKYAPLGIEKTEEAAASAAPSSEKMVDVYAAPMRGYSGALDETRALTESPEYADWLEKAKQVPGVVDAEGGKVGGWIDTESKANMTEPSAVFTVAEPDAHRVAAQLGQGINGEGAKFGAPQQATMIVNRHSPTPNGTSYEINFESPEAMQKWHDQLHQYGIANYTLDTNKQSVILHDVGDALNGNITSFLTDIAKEGDLSGLTKGKSEIQFVNEADYPEIVGGGRAGDLERPGLAAGSPEGNGEGLPGAEAPKAAGLKLPTQDEALQKSKEVADYLSSKYQQAAKSPAWSDTVADYLDRYSQNFGVKNIGGSPGQVRQLGADRARAVGKLSNELGFNKPSVGEIGLTQKINQFADDAGARVGAFRKMADALRNPAENPIDVLQDVRAKLDPVYLRGRGVEATEAGAYQRALEEIEDAQASHQALADVATKLNKQATLATKMKQNPGPYTDVANALSESNNRHIAQVLGPERAAQYEQALKDFGAAKTMQKMHAFKEARDASGRMGPGNLSRLGFQKFMDEVGYKYGAEVARKLADKIRKNPAITKDLPSMFKELHNQIGEVTDETIPAYAGGGILGEVNAYVDQKYGKQRSLKK